MFPEVWRMYSLFGYETDGGRRSILWNTPMYFSEPTGQGGKQLDESLAAWLRTKRPLTRGEILAGLWKKIGDHGYTFVMLFQEDGRFVEHNIATKQTVVHGTWELENGGNITTHVEQREQGNLVIYECDIVANRSGMMYSGIETRNGGSNAYFRVFHFV